MDQIVNKTNSGDLAKEIRELFQIKEQPVEQYSPLALAYIGDGVYDLIIRSMIVMEGNARANQLHHKVSAIVKASSQAELVHKLKPILTEEELAVYRRGRNAKSYTKAKNASMTDYRHATGFEALVGYLYLKHRMERILELIRFGLEEGCE